MKKDAKVQLKRIGLLIAQRESLKEFSRTYLILNSFSDARILFLRSSEKTFFLQLKMNPELMTYD